MLGGTFEKYDIRTKIKIFEKKITDQNFWKNKLSAQKILKEKKFFENIVNDFNFTENELENLEQLLQLATKENDIIVIKDCEKKTDLLLKQIKKKKFELKNLYESPKDVINLQRAGKWAVVQVVKVALGIPIIPGR